MPEIVKTTINGTEYSVELMTTTVAGEVLKTLQNVVLPVIGSYTAFKEQETDGWINEAIAGYLVSMNMHLDIFEISKKLLWNVHIVHVEGKSGTGKLTFKPNTAQSPNPDPFCYDNYFSGKNFKTLFELLVFAVSENFDFFSQLSAVIQSIRTMNTMATVERDSKYQEEISQEDESLGSEQEQ
jgi:hypothetical protein